MAANKPNAYGVFFAPRIKSTLIPNSPVMVERTRPHPQKQPDYGLLEGFYPELIFTKDEKLMSI